MAKRLTLELVTPERPAFSGEGDFVVLPAWDGEMGVLPGHAPFLVQLRPGEVRFTAGGETKLFAVSGGFAEVRDDKVALFAETAEMAESIDAERARQALERARAELLKKDLDSLTLAQAEAALRRAQVRLKVAQLRTARRKP
jgi:F-type H+-transporting ATPase subunit epsilon